jgi:TonB family protein
MVEACEWISSDEESVESNPGQALEKLLRNHPRDADLQRRPVGFFRSQKAGWLSLTDEDLEIAKQLFFRPEDVVLLVRFTENREGTAAFFIWEDGAMRGSRSYHEFPLNVARLALNDRALREPLTVSVVGSESGEPTSARKSLSLLKGLAWLLAIIIVATVGITVVVGLRSANRFGVAAPVPEVKDAYETPLGLKVASSAGRLDVSWDHDSPVILTGSKAVLTITDGDLTKRIQLDEKQMRDGSIAYTPFSTDVNLRLEVGGPDGKTIGESIRVIANNVAPFDNGDPLHVLRAGSQSDAATLRNGGLASMLLKDRGEKDTAEPVDQAAERRRADARLAFETKTPPTKKASLPLSLPHINAGSNNGVSIEPPPIIGVVASAQTDTSLAQMQISAGPPPAAGPGTLEQPLQSATTTIASRPLTSPSPPQVVAPKVVRRVTPALTRDTFPKDKRVEITVVARIDAQGTVWNASLSEDSKGADAQLAAAAITAARQWKFRPASVNGKNVSSEIELHFRFGLDSFRP